MHKLQKKRKSGSPLSEKAYKTRFDSFKFFYLVQNRFPQLSSLIKPNATLAGRLREKYVTRGMSRSIRNHKSQKGKKGKAERKKERKHAETSNDNRIKIKIQFERNCSFRYRFPVPAELNVAKGVTYLFSLGLWNLLQFPRCRQASKQKKNQH